MKNKLLFIALFFIVSCGTRKVDKSVRLEETEREIVTEENASSKDSAFAKVSKISKSMSFDLEPVDGGQAHFVYIVGKDTVRVETNGRLRMRNTDEKKDSIGVKSSAEDYNKKAEAKESASKKDKDTKTERENNSFQFILIGAGLLLALQFAWKFIKDKYFI